MDLSALLDVVPAEYLVYVALALKLLAMTSGFASWVAPIIKAQFGAESKAAKAVDVVAVNTRKADDSKLIGDLRERLAVLERENFDKSTLVKTQAQTIGNMLRGKVP